jgi:two-component system, OmpR family, sensor histidine kinase KdpD
MQLMAGSVGERARTVLPGGVARLLVVAVPALGGATALVWLLEERLGVADASPVYLLAVVVTALTSGTLGALAVACLGILTYDYLFTHPFLTLAISDPGEWISLVLLLFVGVVVGQLTAIQRARTLTAEAREREARELFLVSRALATRVSTPAVLPEIAALLLAAADLRSARISLGADDAAERVVAEAGAPDPLAELRWQLRRMPGDTPAAWIRIHAATSGRARARPVTDLGPSDSTGIATYRVRIEAADRVFGSIWLTRDRRRGHPGRSATRLMSAAADQIGQALAQDRLADEARMAEVARQSDNLKSALLQSVSHDLRTPLATIRAAAGSLQPESGLDAEGRAASAAAIEREVERLDRLVANLLDLGRIEAGELRAQLDVFELDDIAGRTVDRLRPRLDGRDLRVDLDALPVFVDPVFLDEALTNLIENARAFAGDSAAIRVASFRTDDHVTLTVEDDGPGVPEAELGRLFDRFYRAGNGGGMGIGLAVVRGLVGAMGGRVAARRSQLGGLAVELELPLARLPAELSAPTG